jgi:hypothetical protein
MGKESTTPRWVREWERRQRKPWPKYPRRARLQVEATLTLRELLLVLAVLVLLMGLTIKGAAEVRRAAAEADRAAHVQTW